jgi:hypothetical protein
MELLSKYMIVDRDPKSAFGNFNKFLKYKLLGSTGPRNIPVFPS